MAILFSTTSPAGNHFHLGDFTLEVPAPNLATANIFARLHTPEFDAALRQLVVASAQTLPPGTAPGADLHVKVAVDANALSNNNFLVRYDVSI